MFLSEGESDVASHGVTNHDALVDASFVEDSLHHACHEVHGMRLAKGLGLSVTWQVDGDYAEMVHVAQHVGAPYIKVLQKSMKQNHGFFVVTTFVAVVDRVAVDHDCTVLFHISLFFAESDGNARFSLTFDVNITVGRNDDMSIVDALLVHEVVDDVSLLEG